MLKKYGMDYFKSLPIPIAHGELLSTDDGNQMLMGPSIREL